MKLSAAAAILICYTALVIQRAMPGLPEQIPLRFNLQGKPTGSGDPGTLWLLLAAQALITGLILAIPFIARRAPQWVSLGKKRLSDFPPAARDQIQPLIEGACGWTAVSFALFFAILTRQLIRAAQGPGMSPGFWPIPAFLVGLGAVLSYYSWSLIQLTRRLPPSPQRGPAQRQSLSQPPHRFPKR